MESKVILTQKSPEEDANIFSRIFLTWSFDLFRRGYKGSLTMANLWQACKVDESGQVGDRLEQAWELELENAKRYRKKPSLAKAIVKAFWFDYMLCGLLVGVLFVVIWPLIPYTLALFIEYFSEEKTPASYSRAHIYNFLLNFFSALSSIMFSQTFLTQGRVGMRIRVACCSLMYRKILRLNWAGLGKTEPGQVVNLMSNDVNRFDLVTIYLNYVLIMPLLVPLVSYLIWQHIGVATIAALVVIFLQTAVIQVYMSYIQGKYRGKIANRTDERVKVMSELVNGAQVIKMYAWEKPFEKIVDSLRKLEVSYILRTSMVKGFTAALAVFTERFILFAGVATYVLLGGEIRAHTTFALVQYFNLMQLVCSIQAPNGLAYLAETLVSIRRVQEFLLLEEKEPRIKKLKVDHDLKSLLAEEDEKEVIIDGSKPTGLSIVKVTASWNSKDENLKNVTITAKPGEFIGIAGPVGSGKSSLLHLILGELKASHGSVHLGGGTVSYASQEPWLFVASVRDNILFGQPYDPIRYKKVVKACALVRDFELLPYGDSTLVGERGISLSGGQRARIGLARACYRQADIYLLDDPLSAVDTHVGKHMVTECIQNLLYSSTRILVTHQLHHLKEADRIYILRNGAVESQGIFAEVSLTPLFAELLQEVEEDSINEQLGFIRRLSTRSHASSIAPEADKLDDLQEEQEEVEEMSGTGRVPASVYTKYFFAGNGYGLLIFTILAIIIAQVVTSAGDLWLTYWMNIVESQYTSEPQNNLATINENKSLYTLIDNNTTVKSNISSLPLNITIDVVTIGDDNINHVFFIYIWAILIFGCIVLTSARSILFLWTCMRSSIKLHNLMFSNIMGATMRFFDTYPSGRILNRFSKDMGIVDEVMPKMALESIQIFMVMLGILVMVGIVNPFMVLTTAICGVVIYFWTAVYINTAQAIKRVEGVSRSPVFSHVTATMAGLGTVRSSDAQDLLTRQFDDKQDVHTSAWYSTLVANNAFGIWLSMICATYVLIVAYTFLLVDDGTTKSGNVGLAISQGLILVIMVQYGVKQGTEVISQMTSVERLIQFTSLPQEKKDGSNPPEDWPKKGKIVFKNLSLRYAEDMDPVLKNLNIVIKSGWKVGVVGRTGAGKSSLISALFRLAPIEGHILIDEVDTETLNLKQLRSKISIIPQEPVLFSASLRYNLDPFEKYLDADIWQALEQVELKSNVSSLSAPVSSGGTNFSAGERQLLCLARAALARNRLLVLDEATANVDPNTDALIQKSIRKHFKNCTVITVAHRLHTVADADRVLVMDAGRILECGHPYELLKDENGFFSKMVKELGPASESSLREIAGDAYSEHNAKIMENHVSHM